MPGAQGSVVGAEQGTTHADGMTREALRDPVRRAQWLEQVLVECFGMDEEDARMICGVVVEQFGQKLEVLDDELPSDVRSIFYTLEAKRILTFRRIEYKNEDGMTLRGFFWRFHTEGIRETLEAAAEEEREPGVYEKLPADCWQRQAA